MSPIVINCIGNEATIPIAINMVLLAFINVTTDSTYVPHISVLETSSIRTEHAMGKRK